MTLHKVDVAKMPDKFECDEQTMIRVVWYRREVRE